MGNFLDVVFRFHTGSIKSVFASSLFPSMISFDSILVRLKDIAVCIQAALIIGFDSILVRLKDAPPIAGLFWIYAFRFHTGSIKSDHFRVDGHLCIAVSIPYWFD